MQSVSSRIWTRVAVSISCDDNDYTTGTSYYIFRGIVYKKVIEIHSLKLNTKVNNNEDHNIYINVNKYRHHNNVCIFSKWGN